MNMYTLVLIFACGTGCGEPTQVTVQDPLTHKTQKFNSLADCKAAAKQWLDPNGNPTRTIRTYNCRKVK